MEKVHANMQFFDKTILHVYSDEIVLSVEYTCNIDPSTKNGLQTGIIAFGNH